MRSKPIFWQLFPWYSLSIVVSLWAATWYFDGSLDAFYKSHCERELESIARLAEHRLRVGADLADAAEIDAFCKQAGGTTRTRFTVILPDGTVVGDTARDPATMENHADRPEIQQAMRGQRGSSTRPSTTLDAPLLYVAVPLVQEGTVLAVVRASRLLTQLRATVAPVQQQVLLGVLIVGACATITSVVVSRHLARPLEQMRAGAERFAAGELGFRMPEPPSAELSQLARAMNLMAEQLSSRIEAITQERNQGAAILRSMGEGLLAVDLEQQVLTINQAAIDLLRLGHDDTAGHPMQEVVRNPEMLRLASDVLTTGQPASAEVTLHLETTERLLQVRGSALDDAQGQRMGAVIVFNDVTEIRRLERMRREFVANVSHELRTPITSLKGFVETLLDGAVNEPDNAVRFLEIIARHTDRLQAIIEDLLLLSKIENSGDLESVSADETGIESIARAATSFLDHKAKAKGIRVLVDVESGLQARVDPRLMEHALVNLVDNAINYSDDASAITIEARATQGSGVTIAVADEGCGIARTNLPHVFERFYRVDKARSREVGGTGLGLAIVKHIVQAHGGKVTVESAVGEGSTFTVHLPDAADVHTPDSPAAVDPK